MKQIIMDIWNDWLVRFYEKVSSSLERSDDYVPDSSKVAVMIEMRCDPRLRLVMYNFAYLLRQYGWKFCIVHGTTNEEFVHSELYDLSKVVDISFVKIPYSNLSERQYNMLLTNHLFWSTFPSLVKNILIFQTDTVLLKGDLSEYLKYDFIGAPWANNHPQGANGGLSLRNKNAILNALENVGFRYTNEDGFFTLDCGHLLNLPKTENGLDDQLIKATFSVETIFYPEPCGMHKAYEHLESTCIKDILERAWFRLFQEQF